MLWIIELRTNPEKKKVNMAESEHKDQSSPIE